MATREKGDEGSNGCYKGNARAGDIKCDDKKSKWPRIEDLPCTGGIRFGAIIYKC